MQKKMIMGVFENLPLPAQPGTIFTKRTYKQADLLFRLKITHQGRFFPCPAMPGTS